MGVSWCSGARNASSVCKATTAYTVEKDTVQDSIRRDIERDKKAADAVKNSADIRKDAESNAVDTTVQNVVDIGKDT